METTAQRNTGDAATMAGFHSKAFARSKASGLQYILILTVILTPLAVALGYWFSR